MDYWDIDYVRRYLDLPKDIHDDNFIMNLIDVANYHAAPYDIKGGKIHEQKFKEQLFKQTKWKAT